MRKIYFVKDNEAAEKMAAIYRKNQYGFSDVVAAPYRLEIPNVPMDNIAYLHRKAWRRVSWSEGSVFLRIELPNNLIMKNVDNINVEIIEL